MIFQKVLFRKVAILGVGLIGASIGLGLKKKKLVKTIVGVSRRKSSLDEAISVGAIDKATLDWKEAVKGADCVILAAPVNVICTHIEQIAKHLKRNCIVTDVGSTKAQIVREAHQHFSPSVLFVGSHPLAGSEKKGPAFGNADLFEGSTCVMTPIDQTNRLAKEKIKHLWGCLGAKIKFMDPAEHDKALSYVSHLPHLAAFGLMQSIPENCLPFAATGLKDTTRIAASDADMWKDIFLSNRQNVINSLDEMVAILSDYRSALIDRDQKRIQQLCEKAKSKRESLL